MKDTIAEWALWLSIASFVLYLVTAAAQVIAQFKSANGAAQTADAIPNVTSFFVVLKDLVEALSKASPSLVAVIASIAYLAMAGFASGVW
ncbi:hypothetical protein NKI59_22555 [Mesorhizobium sp. M0598]|uniref:hypothetical protein n=1 Tax=Mesorhizobium sp. M0598 TaxID=2956968 RepID=UPI0033376DA2